MEPKQYYIGIDVGGTSVKEGLFDEDGNLLAKASVPTPPIVDAAGFAAVTEAIDQVVAKAQIPRAFVAGIGLAVPCPIPAAGDAKVKANISINLPELKIAIQEHCPDAVVSTRTTPTPPPWARLARLCQGRAERGDGHHRYRRGRRRHHQRRRCVGRCGCRRRDWPHVPEPRRGAYLRLRRPWHLEQYSSATGVVSNYLAECKAAGVEPSSSPVLPIPRTYSKPAARR